MLVKISLKNRIQVTLSHKMFNSSKLLVPFQKKSSPSNVAFHCLGIHNSKAISCKFVYYWFTNKLAINLQVCIQLPTSSVNVALPAFAAAASAVQQSIDISCPSGPQQQPRSTLLQRSNKTYKRTDTVPLHRPCSAYYAGSANKNAHRGERAYSDFGISLLDAMKTQLTRITSITNKLKNVHDTS